jgi:6-phosphofructokinase 1
VATEAIDRLHSTATGHHRFVLSNIMGHIAGWAPGRRRRGRRDVILILNSLLLEKVADSILGAERKGKRFSIVAFLKAPWTRYV